MEHEALSQSIPSAAAAPPDSTYYFTLSAASVARLRQNLLSVDAAAEIALRVMDKGIEAYDELGAILDVHQVFQALENRLRRDNPLHPSNLTIRIAIAVVDPSRLRRALSFVQVAVEASLRAIDKAAEVSNEEAAVPAARLFFAALENALRGNNSLH